ncbi:hypothetical protein MAM1_0315d09577 [Mucor ambiguus]|uniref:Uncharacterized protein n=1 Tax=Mucor ambiguus TaxID=91626 RepID=A0A0C9N632_9FUNG|nr:hypothetical protein MAM1_0315d09577 [Mucor ambiguus]
MVDDNWGDIFSNAERSEIERLVSAINYHPLPDDMADFLRAIPSTEDLTIMFNHLESIVLDYKTEKHLLWLKYSFLNAIYLIDNHYLPITDQSEEDLCGRVWRFLGDAFNTGKLVAKKQKSSAASKEANYKKRKLAMMEAAVRQKSPLIPDISICHGSQEYAIIEVAKSDNNLKQLLEGNKKCPELMADIFDQVCAAYLS